MTARVTSTVDMFMMTAVMIASSIGVEDVVIVDIYGVSGYQVGVSLYPYPAPGPSLRTILSMSCMGNLITPRDIDAALAPLGVRAW